jgi:tetratricopeptide (TPR) repeat protein
VSKADPEHVSPTDDHPSVFDDMLEGLADIAPGSFRLKLDQTSETPDHDDWSTLFFELESLAECGLGEQSIELTLVCRDIADASGDRWLQCAARHFLGGVYQAAGKLEAAAESYTDAAELAVRGRRDVRHLTALALQAAAHVHMSLGLLPVAIEQVQRSIRISQETDSPDDEIAGLILLANLHLTKEQFDTAEDTAREAIDLSDEWDLPLLQASAFSVLGDIQSEVTDYPAALDSYDETLDLLDGIVDETDEEVWRQTYCATLGSRAMVLEELDRFPEAMDDYTSAARMAHEIRDWRRQAQYITWLGTVQKDIGRHDLAQRSYSAAIRLCEGVGDVTWTPTVYLHQSNLNREAGEFVRARAAVEQAMGILDDPDGSNLADSGMCQMHLGDLSLEEGNAEAAIQEFERALDMFERSGIGAMHRRIAARLGRAFRMAGDLLQAKASLTDALTVYESKRSSLRSESARIDFGPTRDDAIEDLVLVELGLNSPLHAFQAAEQSKGRVLLEQLAKRGISTEEAAVTDLNEVKTWLKNV